MARPKRSGGRVTPKGTQPAARRRPATMPRPRVERVTFKPDQFIAGAQAAGVDPAALQDRTLAAIDREARRRLPSA